MTLHNVPLAHPRPDAGQFIDILMGRMREIAGDVRSYEVRTQEVGGVRWCVVRLVYECEAIGVLEVLPTAGCTAETYEIFGAGCRAQVRVGGPDTGEVRCWQGGELDLEDEPAQGELTCVRNGAYGETVAFVAALQEGRALYPTPAQVLQTVELCEQIERRALKE